jgi:hypothetical protein
MVSNQLCGHEMAPRPPVISSFLSFLQAENKPVKTEMNNNIDKILIDLLIIETEDFIKISL